MKDPASESSGPQGDGVLMVTAEPAGACETIVRRLEKIGLVVRRAERGPAAPAAAREALPAVVVSGPGVPLTDGLDCAREVGVDAAGERAYLIALLDRDAAPNVASALDAGADDALREPLDPAEVVARIRAALRRRAARTERVEVLRRDVLLQLAATVGHEINNPLTALLGHLEMARHDLREGSAVEAQRHLGVAGEVVSRIREVARRLTLLTEPRLIPYLGDQQMLDLAAGRPAVPAADPRKRSA